MDAFAQELFTPLPFTHGNGSTLSCRLAWNTAPRSGSGENRYIIKSLIVERSRTINKWSTELRPPSLMASSLVDQGNLFPRISRNYISVSARMNQLLDSRKNVQKFQNLHYGSAYRRDLIWTEKDNQSSFCLIYYIQ